MPFQQWEDAIAPPWLQQPGGADYIGASGYEKDYLAAQLKLGIKQRFPNYAYTDALAAIGKERGINQGAAESLAAYETDVLNAWSLWQFAGTFYGLLNEFKRQGYSNVVILQQQFGAYTLSAGNLVITAYPSSFGTKPSSSGVPFGRGLKTTQLLFDLGQPLVVGGQTQPQRPPGTGIGPPLPLNGAVLQGAVTPCYLPTLVDSPGTIQTRRWARYAVLFVTPFPSNWTSTPATPLTTGTTPSLAEMNSIRGIITTWGPGGAVCVGITALISGRLRSWPIRYFGDGANWQNSQAVTWSCLSGSAT